MRHAWRWAAAAAALAIAQPTFAAAGPSLIGWTNGGSLGDGQQAFMATAGWPGLSVGYLRGLSHTLDAGARFSFNYGGEGSTDLPWLGVELAADLKLRFDLGLPFAVGLRALPGAHLYFPQGFTVLSAALPLELFAGLPLSPELMVHVSVKAPVALGFWNGFSARFMLLQVPVLAGGGAELRLDPSLSLHAQLHLGAYEQIFIGGGTISSFAFDALVGFTYRPQ